MFRFESPQWLQLIWLVLVLTILGWVLLRGASHKLQKALGKKMFPFLSNSVSSKKRKWKLFLQGFVLSLMIIALARPQMGESMQEIKSQGVEIVIAVDVSNSMMTEDVKPSRLEFAKKELSRLVERFAGDRVGIIVFAGSAALISPLTTDYGAIKMFLDSLSTDSISSQGTAFAKAIQEGYDAFKAGGVSDDDTNRVTRVLLIASDGEDHEPGAITLAQKLTEKGMRIFTMGFGTEKGGAIPVRDEFGNLTGYKKDSSGQVILSTSNGKELRAIAEAGKGAYYQATPGGNAAEKIKEEVDKLQKSEFDSKLATNYDEQFQIVLLCAILLGLLELYLGERKSQSRLWRGRFEVTES